MRPHKCPCYTYNARIEQDEGRHIKWFFVPYLRDVVRICDVHARLRHGRPSDGELPARLPAHDSAIGSSSRYSDGAFHAGSLQLLVNLLGDEDRTAGSIFGVGVDVRRDANSADEGDSTEVV